MIYIFLMVNLASPLPAGADPTEGHDENKEYCCVLRSRLALHSLVYGAEVDGAEPTRYNPPHAHLTPFVELKTTKEIVSDRHKQILHKFKFQKWWSQSFLVGIPRVICGFRDDSGVVRSLQTFAVSTMPTQCQVRKKIARALTPISSNNTDTASYPF